MHRSLPEIDRDDIDLSTSFLGRRFKYPLVISALTGGYQGAREYLEGFIEELAVAMFLAGAVKLSELGDKKLVVTGATRDWLAVLGHDSNPGK